MSDEELIALNYSLMKAAKVAKSSRTMTMMVVVVAESVVKSMKEDGYDVRVYYQLD